MDELNIWVIYKYSIILRLQKERTLHRNIATSSPNSLTLCILFRDVTSLHFSIFVRHEWGARLKFGGGHNNTAVKSTRRYDQLLSYEQSRLDGELP